VIAFVALIAAKVAAASLTAVLPAASSEVEDVATVDALNAFAAVASSAALASAVFAAVFAAVNAVAVVAVAVAAAVSAATAAS
jgi:hypothetical protein